MAIVARFPSASRLRLSVALGALLIASPALAQTTTWTAGDGLWSNAANWDNGIPAAGGDAVVDADPGSDVTVTIAADASVGTLTIGAGDSVALNNLRTLTLGGGLLNNDGRFALTSVGSVTRLALTSDTLFAGSGVVELSNSAGNRIGGSTGRVLSQAAGHTIRGSGQIGEGELGLDNLGTIEASGSVGLTVALRTAFGLTRRNAGVLRAASGSTLTLDAGQLDNSGGTIEAAEGGIVSVVAATQISGGELTGPGSIRLSGNSRIEDLTNTGTVVVTNTNEGRLLGTIVNDGVIALASTGSTTRLGLDGDATLTGSGVLELSGSANNIIGAPSHSGFRTLTQTAGHTIRGAGNLGDGDIGLDNAGLIEAVGAAGLTLQLRVLSGATRRNSGTLRGSDGSTLRITSGVLDNAGGTIEAAAGGTVVITGTSTRILGGTLTGAGTLALEGQATLQDVANTGTISIRNTQIGVVAGDIGNAGTISVESVGSTTRLRLGSDTTLSGGGTLLLSGSANNIIDGASVGFVLTQAAGHSIRGAGNLGSSDLGLDNAGLIEAAGAAGLTVQLRSATGVLRRNTGTMRASDGSTLRFTAAELDNSAGVIEAAAGGTVEVTGVNTRIVGGLLTGAGVHTVSGSATLVDVANDGTIRIANTATGRVEGAMANDGTIELASTGSTTTLSIVDDVTLGGSGSVAMSNSANNRISGTVGATLTQLAGHAIRGAGNVGNGSLGLNNAGLIEAVGSAGLTVQLRTADGTTRVNTGTMRAADGGTLTLQTGGTLENAGGIIEAAAGGTVVLTGAATRIEGGTITGPGAVQMRTNAVIADLFSDAAITIANTETGRIAGTVVNEGTITLASTGSTTNLHILGDTTLQGTGLLLLSGNANNRVLDPSGGAAVLTQGADHTIRGTSNNFGLSGNLTLNNLGTIEAQGAGGLDLRLSAQTHTNAGTMRALGGSTLTLGNAFDNAGGLIAADDGALVAMGSGTRIVGGRLATEGSGAIRLSASATLDGVTNEGLVEVLNAQTGRLAGAITNDGEIAVKAGTSNTDLVVTGDTLLGGEGALVLSQAQANRARVYGTGTEPILLTNLAGHTIRGSGGIGDIGGNALGLRNEGLIEADGAFALTLNPNAALDPSVNTGTLRASGSGGMVLTGAAFSNEGLVEAVNGSSVTWTAAASTANNQSGVLVGGRWRAAGDGSVIAIRGPAIATASAEIILDGAGSQFRTVDGVVTTALEQSLGTVTAGGVLRILGGRDYTVDTGTGALDNLGLIELGGGTLAADTLSNSGTIAGFGTILPAYANSGTTVATGGVLTVANGIFGSGEARVEADGTLALGADAASGLLVLNGGTLALGTRDFTVAGDYVNTAFGSGNDFDRRNVTGSGAILSAGADLGIGDAAIPLGGDTVLLDFGIVRAGESATLSYSLANSGTAGVLRGAIQTAANGASIDDARLSGTGVIAQNFDPLSAFGPAQGFDVTFTADAGGALGGQRLAVVSNFDNVATRTILLDGFATARAVGQAAPAGPLDLGAFRVGLDGPSQALAVTNLTDGDGAERLGIGALSASAGFSAVDLGAGPVAPGGTAPEALRIAVSGGAAGLNTGSVLVQYVSDGTAYDAGFAAVDSNAETIAVSATGWNVAVAEVSPGAVVIANQRVGGDGSAAVAVANAAPADGFGEALNFAVAGTSGAATSNGAGAAGIAAGGASSVLSVGVDTAVAGLRSGTVTLGFESDGAGTSGLGVLDLGTQEIAVSGAVFALAEGRLDTAPLSFGTVQVGQSVTRALSVSNVATGPEGFVEDLAVAFGAASGLGAGQIGGSGAIAGLVAGATDTGSMVVSVDTSLAGTIDGAIALLYTSTGTVAGVANGLGAVAVGSDSFGVAGVIEATGTVIDTARPVIDTAQPVALGNVRVGDAAPVAAIAVTNAATGTDQAALNASIAGSGAVTAAGSFALLAPGATDATSLSVSMDTATAGAVNGTATIAFVSDASGFGGCEPDCALALPSQSVAVTGGVFQTAQPVLPDSVDVGGFRLGDSASAAVGIANALAAPAGFQEALDVAIAGTTGAVTAAGGIAALAAGAASDAIAVTVGGAAAVAGVNAGTVRLALASNGAGTSGLDTLALGEAEVAVSGTGYRIADPALLTAAVDLAARRGDAAPVAAIAVENRSPDAFTEALAVDLGAAPAGFVASGAIAALAAGGTDGTSLSVALDTAVAGSVGGDLAVGFASTGAGTSGAADLALEGATVALSGRVYEAAQGRLDTPAIDFGIVRVGDAVAAQALAVTNTAPVAGLNDTLAAAFDGPLGGPFAAAGSAVEGLGAGDSAASLAVGLDTATAGVFALSLADAVRFTSRNPELADLDLGTAALTLTAQVNELVRPAFALLDGAATLTGSGVSFLLDLGTVILGQTVGASLALLNDVAGPADALFGSFDTTAADAFALAGFDPVADLAAGASSGPLELSFTALLEGTVSQTVTFAGFGRNAFGPDLGFDSVSLTLRATARAADPDPGVIPLPAAGWLLLGGLATLATLRRRRRA